MQVTHQVTCSFCPASCSQLASFLPMETQSRGALPAHTCLYMAKQCINFFGEVGSSASLVFISTGLDSDSNTPCAYCTPLFRHLSANSSSLNTQGNTQGMPWVSQHHSALQHFISQLSNRESPCCMQREVL